MKNTFEISELTPTMLANAFAYYHRGRFWKYNFDEWLLNEFEAVRDCNNKLVSIVREYKSRYGYETERITDYALNDTQIFLNLLNKINK